MRNLGLILMFLIISLNLSGQSKDDKILKISGVSRIAIQPDRGIMNVEIDAIDTSMEISMEKLRLQTEGFFKILDEMGFENEKVSTSDFSVHKNIIHDRINIRDSGFIASQVIRSEFEYNDTIMDYILTEIASKAPDMVLNFDFMLSENQKAEVQKNIIDLAIKDANEKANFIVEATGKKIMDIKEIQYDFTPRYSSDKSGMIEINLGYHKYSSNSGLMSSRRKNFNFKPEDIIFHDSVIIFFEID